MNILSQKTYVCTSDALARGDCTREQLGHFILDLPQDKPINETSFWSARVLLSSDTAGSSTLTTKEVDLESFNRETRSPIPKTEAPWRRDVLVDRENPNPSPGGIFQYQKPIHYLVQKTGYYCVGVYLVALTTFPSLESPCQP